jgi:hypothetical protein
MDEIKEMAKQARLWQKVAELYDEVAMFDDGVREYFDLESDEMLEKKFKVLNALSKGESPEDIGKDYFDILEGFDQGAVPEGQTVMVGDVEFNK